jgi:hypothetical protein
MIEEHVDSLPAQLLASSVTYPEFRSYEAKHKLTGGKPSEDVSELKTVNCILLITVGLRRRSPL